MEDLFSAHQDVQAGRVPKLVQFGAGPLSVLDPTQAPPGKHTNYAWHVMPLELRPRTIASYEAFKQEFADKIIETWARYCPNMTRAQHHRPATSTPRANIRASSSTCATATSSWARSTPSR